MRIIAQALEIKDGDKKSIGRSKSAFARLLNQGSLKSKKESFQASTSVKNGGHCDMEAQIVVNHGVVSTLTTS